MFLKHLSKLANLSALRYFYEVARAGSIRGAAEAMFIAPSAVSRQIRLLEDDLGVALLVRHPGGVTLTPSGEVLLHHTLRAMKELAHARTEMEALTGGHRGSVLIGVNETIGREFMTQFLLDFYEKQPDIVPHVTVGNTATLVEMLLRKKLDILLGYGVQDHPELTRLNSYTLTVCAMLNSGHPLASKPSVTVLELSEEKFIMPDCTLSLRRTIDNIFSAQALRPRAIMETNSFEMMANLVAAGHAVGVQIRLGIGPDQIRPSIVYVPIREATTQPVALASCMLRGSIPSVPAEIFAQELSATLSHWMDRLQGVSCSGACGPASGG